MILNNSQFMKAKHATHNPLGSTWNTLTLKNSNLILFYGVITTLTFLLFA